MNEITPLAPNTKGKEVANLQEALQLFLKEKVFKELQPPNSPTAQDLARLAENLKPEIAETVYSKATTELIRIFQIQQGLGDNLRGIVEATTAKKMNELLGKLGAFGSRNDQQYTVSGTVLNSDGVTLKGYVVEVFICCK